MSVVTLAGLLTLGQVSSARAEGWTASPSLSQNGQYDTNPLMRRNDAQSIYGSITTPQIVFAEQSQTSTARLTLGINENVFNRSDFNSTDLQSSADVSRSTQRWTAGITGGVTYDTTRTSEQTTYGLNTASVRHLGINVGPQISYKATPTSTLGLASSFAMSRYADNASYTDYNTASLTPNYEYAFTPLTSGLFRFLARRYQTTSGSFVREDNLGPSAGFRMELVPRMILTTLIGVQASRRTENNASPKPWTYQYTYTNSLTFKGEQDTASIAATRQQQSYGNATDATTATYEIKDSHKLNERFLLNGSLRYESIAQQDNAAGSLDSRLVAQPGLTYHLTDTVDINSQYAYRRETLLGQSGATQGHVVTVGIVYSPTPWSMW